MPDVKAPTSMQVIIGGAGALVVLLKPGLAAPVR